MDQHREEGIFPGGKPAANSLPGEEGAVGSREEALLQASFPHIYAFCLSQGYYRIPDAELLTSSLEGGFMLQTPRNTAVLRLDLGISCLWPLVSHLFNFNVFPSRLAAALHLLRAADFGEEAADPQLGALCQELSQALDALEALLAEEAAPAEEQAAAEPDPED